MLPGGQQNGSWYLKASNTQAEDVSVGYTKQQYISTSPADAPRHGLWKIDLTGSGLNQGSLEIEIEAYDEAGNLATRTARYYVNDPDAHHTGKILNLNENSPPITDRFEVIGNASWSDENGDGAYDLKLISLEDPNDYVYLAKDEPAIVTDGLLGVVDGTMIPTGQYRLNLEVRCQGGCIKAGDERIIEIQNEARLGNLDLTFSDLNVVLGGVPIPMIRTYSSGLVNDLGSTFESDFSAGWNLNFLQSEVSVSHPEGVTTSINDAFADGTRVYVSLPDGSVHRFTFDPVRRGNVYVPYLNSDPEFNSELYLLDYDENLRLVLNEQRGDGTFVSTNDNKESIPSNFGSAWVLQTENGLSYIFDIKTGQLTAIEDQSDARIDVERSEDGTQITISTKNTGTDNQDGNTVTESIVIHRQVIPGTENDPQYRVISITDPVVENPVDRNVSYRYGEFDPANGLDENAPQQHLAQVQLRDESVASYGYNDPVLPLHLTDIYDNSSAVVFHAEYFNAIADHDGDGEITQADRAIQKDYGRLRSTSSGNGNEIGFEFEFDLGDGRKVRRTNAAGTATEEVINGRGDVLRLVSLVGDSTDDTQKRYLVTVSRYNLRGLVTAQSKPFYVTGAANRFTEQPADAKVDPLAWASLTTYDDRGRVLTVTDGTGAVITRTYDDKHGIQTSTNAYGITNYIVSDPATGRLTETYVSRRDSDQRTGHIRYEYNDFGQQTRELEVLPSGDEVLLSRIFL